MAGYLKRFTDKYRVIAEYDLSTNDFPRTHDGNLDPSFDDLYIPCGTKIRIYYNGKGNMILFCEGVVRGKRLYEEILNQYGDIVFNLNVLDGEMSFCFKTKDLDSVAKLAKAKTNGHNISPFSTRNLPKEKYSIPIEDLAKYKALIKQIPEGKQVYLSHITKRFNAVILAKKGKAYNLLLEKRKSMLKSKEFIHSIGLWDEYIKFIENELIKNRGK